MCVCFVNDIPVCTLYCFFICMYVCMYVYVNIGPYRTYIEGPNEFQRYQTQRKFKINGDEGDNGSYKNRGSHIAPSMAIKHPVTAKHITKKEHIPFVRRAHDPTITFKDKQKLKNRESNKNLLQSSSSSAVDKNKNCFKFDATSGELSYQPDVTIRDNCDDNDDDDDDTNCSYEQYLKGITRKYDLDVDSARCDLDSTWNSVKSGMIISSYSSSSLESSSSSSSSLSASYFLSIYIYIYIYIV